MEIISEIGEHQHNKTLSTAVPDEFKGVEVLYRWVKRWAEWNRL